MENINTLNVFCEEKQVGTLAMYKGTLAAFQYTEAWRKNGFSISPFSLPLSGNLYIPRFDPFDGLYGIFADSLPDGWGRLLVDRMLVKQRVNPMQLNPLTRLAIVGSAGMGALSYRPAYPLSSSDADRDFDLLAEECMRILRDEECSDLDELFLLGGSSGGARPKALMSIDGEEWIVKFPSSVDPRNIGKLEYDYNECAARCGIEVSGHKLFPSKCCSGYFGSKRFDRMSDHGITRPVHMASVSALLEVSHRVPALDYNSLMTLTFQLTRDYTEVEKMFRIMCFNVFAHNRDDHSNNFTFIFDGQTWRLSPAYDLTYSSSLGGEHATMVNGNGKNPGVKDILAVAVRIGLPLRKAEQTAEEIQQITADMLGQYL